MSEGYYGRNGALGLATPQANPTAETEFRILMPKGVACATVRMVSAEPDPATRLRAYFTDIGQTLMGSILSRCRRLDWPAQDRLIFSVMRQLRRILAS